MIDRYLEQLGLTNREIQVLLSLLESGDAGPQEISRRTKIPRSSIYSILETLAAKDLVLTSPGADLEHAHAQYRIAAPSAFRSLVAREREKVSKHEKAVEHLISLLEPRYLESNPGIPRLRYFSGKEEIEEMLFSHYQKWRDSMREYDFTWWGHQDNTFVSQYQRWFNRAWSDTDSKEFVKLFSNWSTDELSRLGKITNRTIKPIPPQFKISSTLWVVGDFIVMIASQHKPHYAFELIDRVLAENLRHIFQFLWLITPGFSMGKKP